MADLSETQVAWLAGILEGEGAFMIQTNGKYRIARIKVSMYDKDIIKRVSRLLSTTVTTHIVWRAGVEKTVYSTSLARKKDLKIILKRLLPYMGKRRGARIDELLAHMEA